MVSVAGAMAKAYLALEDTESTLVDVHDGIVNPLPLVNHSVLVNSRHDICRAVVLSTVGALPLLRSLFREPSRLPCKLVFLF